MHDARPGHHERYPHRVIQGRHLVPETAFAEHVAVIAGEDHNRVVEQFRLLEGPDDLPDLAVDVGGVRVVGPPGVRDLLVGHRDIGGLDGTAKPQGMRILSERRCGEVDLDALVAIPELWSGDIRVMWVDEADRHRKRQVSILGVIEDPPLCGEGDLLVVFELERRCRRAGLLHRIHVVVPLVDPLVRVVPVGGPRVIAGVDVGGEAFFKPVELIGSDEVHFAGQAGAVAELAQIVGERGN